MNNRQKLRSWVTKFVKTFPVPLREAEFDEYVVGLSCIVAMILLKEKDSLKYFTETRVHKNFFRQEIDILSGVSPKLYSHVEGFFDIVGEKQINPILISLCDLVSNDDFRNEDISAWLYQYLKKERERSIFRASLNGSKIIGDEVHIATQFFTESYMIDYLLRSSMLHINKTKPRTSIQFIDPACGSGNFLIHAMYFNKLHSTSPENKPHLIGYDIDPIIAKIGSLNLFVQNRIKCTNDTNLSWRILTATSNSAHGFLNTSEDKPWNLNTQDPWTGEYINLSELISAHSLHILATNPPFMGIRNMDRSLKTFLLNRYPEVKGDLCSSFMLKCLKSLDKDDVLAIVNQTSWMYLKSLVGLRQIVLNEYQIISCIELGSDAFQDISGEKTNVALTVLSKSKSKVSSVFVNLRDYNLNQKVSIIEKDRIPKKNNFVVSQASFKNNPTFEINYLLANGLKSKFDQFPLYGEFATPMQGTSTGNNRELISFSWENYNDPDWVSVSKGGGYCKWMGLNRYRVKWGDNAKHIRANPGSALRNLDKMGLTQLVYSDTGTLGMNVRILKPGQVFIASGPGIHILKGSTYAHLGFLNSRMSSFLMKALSPKLTISAGYISKLSIPEQIIHNNLIETYSKKCVGYKHKVLSSKITNDEFTTFPMRSFRSLSSHLQHLIIIDLDLEAERLYYESRIEYEITKVFKLSKTEYSQIVERVGIPAGALPKRTFRIDVDELDHLISKSLDANCQFAGSRGRNALLGVEGVLEMLSFRYNTNPASILNFIKANISLLQNTTELYLWDFLHKSVLYCSGFKSNTVRQSNTQGVERIVKDISDQLGNFMNDVSKILANKMTPVDWIYGCLKEHHSASFLNKPVLTFAQSSNGTISRIKLS